MESKFQNKPVRFSSTRWAGIYLKNTYLKMHPIASQMLTQFVLCEPNVSTILNNEPFSRTCSIS